MTETISQGQSSCCRAELEALGVAASDSDTDDDDSPKTDDYFVLEADLSSVGGYVNFMTVSVPIGQFLRPHF